MAAPKFSRKAVQESVSGGTQDYTKQNEWKMAQWDAYKGSATTNGTKQRKERPILGVVNYIFDAGLPQAEDSQWQTKVAVPEGDEKYSKEEIEWMDDPKNKGHDFKWVQDWDKNANGGKGGMTQQRKQTSPSWPKQEYCVCVDFPSIMVDYSKHYNSTSTEPDLRPLRLSLNGQDFHDRDKIGTALDFQAHWKTGLVAENNTIYKICKFAGREQELIDSEFDIAVAAQAVCNFKVTFDLNQKDDNVYLNTKVNTPSAVADMLDPETQDVLYTAEQLSQKALDNPKLVPFTGILLTMPMADYTDEMFNMIGTNDRYNHVARAKLSVREEKISAAGNAYAQGIVLTDEAGEVVFEEINGKSRPLIGGYEDTNFAKAYEAWKAKQGDKPTGGSQGDAKPSPKQTPVEAKKAPPVKAPEPVDEFEDIPFAPMWLQYGKSSILSM